MTALDNPSVGILQCTGCSEVEGCGLRQ
jgi:hypothetical protein